MKIITKAEYQWDEKTQSYRLVDEVSINWTGPVALCKGASDAQTELQQQQADFYKTLSKDYNTQFEAQNAILGLLQDKLKPIIQAGPNQFGFSAGETNALNSQAVQGTGQEFAKVNQAVKEGQAAQGGGNQVLPSGVQQQQRQQVAQAAADQSSNQLLGIQQAGYQQGHQDYENAVGQLGGVAGMYSPSSYASQATGAGNSAFDAATEINKENNAASPWGVVGGLLGGAAQTFANGFAGDLGKSAAKKL